MQYLSTSAVVMHGLRRLGHLQSRVLTSSAHTTSGTKVYKITVRFCTHTLEFNCELIGIIKAELLFAQTRTTSFGIASKSHIMHPRIATISAHLLSQRAKIGANNARMALGVFAAAVVVVVAAMMVIIGSETEMLVAASGTSALDSASLKLANMSLPESFTLVALTCVVPVKGSAIS